ncbi:MAG: hypothetical protein JWR26_4416 [Pedosphaera sp.]|nr:hypothetical protein [Pedosphaera sp.]
MNWAQHILIFFVRVYQRVISPAKTAIFGPMGHCRFTPSCSQYAIEAIRTHGALKGCLLGAWRLCRCHPWGGFGEDPVPAVKTGISRRARAHCCEGSDGLGAVSGGRS